MCADNRCRACTQGGWDPTERPVAGAHARLPCMGPDGIQGLLLDIDGVLAVSWLPIPGSIETLSMLREQGMPIRLITNTTTHTRVDLATTLREAGFAVEPDEI